MAKGFFVAPFQGDKFKKWYLYWDTGRPVQEFVTPFGNKRQTMPFNRVEPFHSSGGWVLGDTAEECIAMARSLPIDDLPSKIEIREAVE